MIIVSSPLGFAGTTIRFEEVPFPSTLQGCVSFVGHPTTRQLLEQLGATTDNSNNGAPGKWFGPAIGEQYLAVPLMNNAREGGFTTEQAVSSIASLKAILCTRIA